MTETALRAKVYLTHPRPESMSLEVIGTRGSTLALHLHSNGHAYVMLGGPGADREADAKAMERLAELAKEAAAKLRESIAKCVECGTTAGIVQQRNHQTSELDWLCEACHHAATCGTCDRCTGDDTGSSGRYPELMLGGEL